MSNSASNQAPAEILSSESAAAIVAKHLKLWSERNSEFRKNELPKIYSADVKVLDPYIEINSLLEMNDFIDGLLVKFPDSNFTVLRPVDSHNNIARLFWGFGTASNPQEITGQDFFTFEKGKIKSLSIFLDI